MPFLSLVSSIFREGWKKRGLAVFCDPLLLRAIMRAQGQSFVYERVSEGRVSVEKGVARRKRI